MDNEHYQQLIKLRFVISPFMGKEKSNKWKHQLHLQKRNDTFIERECEQVGIFDNLLSNFFAGVTLFASKGKPEG
jgi:hypothetical protein